MTVSVPVARRVKAPVSDAWIKKMVTAALRGAKKTASTEVGVVFVSDREMTKLNTVHRNKKKTTDVLSFADGAHGLLGDIVISVAQAEKQAKEAKKTLRSELALLLVHGVLHLLGYDHETLKDEKVMFALQRRILKSQTYA
ncbi:MAG: rRNA maturation RNase YbeY [Patescibacteria group bacterium]|nr:MAG: rRNA maturation RNase YbeY [Patescibacteria group bacterium]